MVHYPYCQCWKRFSEEQGKTLDLKIPHPGNPTSSSIWSQKRIHYTSDFESGLSQSLSSETNDLVFTVFAITDPPFTIPPQYHHILSPQTKHFLFVSNSPKILCPRITRQSARRRRPHVQYLQVEKKKKEKITITTTVSTNFHTPNHLLSRVALHQFKTKRMISRVTPPPVGSNLGTGAFVSRLNVYSGRKEAVCISVNDWLIFLHGGFNIAILFLVVQATAKSKCMRGWPGVQERDNRLVTYTLSKSAMTLPPC